MESERDVYRQFQDWCLRTYGDSGKTKTVTRKKYERIVQLLNGSESSSTDNAKFKFWVKSKGFQLGQPDEVRGVGGGAKQVLFVRVKTTVSRLLCYLSAGAARKGGRREGEAGGCWSHCWLLPPQTPSPSRPQTRWPGCDSPSRKSLWSFILKRQRTRRAGGPPCLRAALRCGTVAGSLSSPRRVCPVLTQPGHCPMSFAGSLTRVLPRPGHIKARARSPAARSDNRRC